MTKVFTAVSLLALLAACGDGQPLYDDDDVAAGAVDPATGVDGVVTNPDDEVGDGGSIDVGTLPPGTDNPTRTGDIFRFEERNEEDNGGLVTDVSYDAGTDTFTVDNIAFDGANVYQRESDVPTLATYAVFEADTTTPDFLTGNPVSQIVPYRAILGTSRNLNDDGSARTTFAIVHTGGYFSYGFGGYVYERQGGATLPTTGQATFEGDYAGVRVYDNAGGLDYVQGEINLDIDFDDFNANDGVKGRVTERQLFDESGAFIENLTNIRWTIVEGSNTITEDGEIVSDVFTVEIDPTSNEPVINLEGTFTAIIAGDTLELGDGGGEVVGVVKIEGPDLDREGVSIQETGGAILYRDNP